MMSSLETITSCAACYLGSNFGGMKVKTSVSISEDVLREIDCAATEGVSRSEYIEQVLKRHFRLKRREERDRRDAEIYERMAAEERSEAEEWLELQPDLAEFGDEVSALIDEDAFRAAG